MNVTVFHTQIEKYRPEHLGDVAAHKEIVDTSMRTSLLCEWTILSTGKMGRKG